MIVLSSPDLSLDIPSQFRQKRSKDQEPGPTCTLSGKCPAVLADWWSITCCVYFNNSGLYSFIGFCLDCLRSFTDLEELDETELYFCHKCKKRQKSTKKFWVQKLPKVGDNSFSAYLGTFLHFTALRHESCDKKRLWFRWRFYFLC